MKTSKFQFSNPKVIKLFFQPNEDYKPIKKNKLTTKSEISKHIIEDNKAIVILSLEIGEDIKEQPFYISIDMSAVFTYNGDASDIEFDKLLSINAPAMLLSYTRPIISLITSQAGFPALNVPFVNFTDEED